jgi:hypothetical protein
MRTVIHSDKFTKDFNEVVEKLAVDPEEILEGLEWVLARDAEKGTHVPVQDSPITLLCMSYGVSSNAVILIFYNFENHDVCLQGATLSDLDLF